MTQSLSDTSLWFMKKNGDVILLLFRKFFFYLSVNNTKAPILGWCVSGNPNPKWRTVSDFVS